MLYLNTVRSVDTQPGTVEKNGKRQRGDVNAQHNRHSIKAMIETGKEIRRTTRKGGTTCLTHSQKQTAGQLRVDTMTLAHTSTHR